MAYATIQRGASEGIWSIDSEEGSSFCIPRQIAIRAGFFEGQQLDFQQCKQLKDYYESCVVREKAISLLARREHSRKELLLKLLQRGYAKETILAELDRLERERIIDDRRYAEAFIASRQAKNPEGRPMLQARLLQRGIDRSVIDEMLDRWFADEQQVESDVIKALKKIARSCSSTEQIIIKLQRKGFSIHLIRQVLDQLD